MNKNRYKLGRRTIRLILICSILNSILLINGANYSLRELPKKQPTSETLHATTATDPYKIKISENPLELGKTVEIVVGVMEELGIIQVLIEYEAQNHSMKGGGVNIWVCDNWTPSEVGTFPFTIYLENKSSNWDNFGGVLKVVIDATPPEFSTINEDSEEVNPGERIKFSINIKDLYGIKSVLLEFKGVNYSMVNLPDTDIWQYELTAPESEGTYDYTIYMEDNYNNWNISAGTIQVIDSSVPENIIPPIIWLPIVGIFFLGLMIGVISTYKLRKSYNSRDSESDQLIQPICKKNKNDYKPLKVQCPICRSSKEVLIPKLILNASKGIITVTIPNKLVCNHHFQVFIDHFCEIRGYQPSDYEVDMSADEE